MTLTLWQAEPQRLVVVLGLHQNWSPAEPAVTLRSLYFSYVITCLHTTACGLCTMFTHSYQVSTSVLMGVVATLKVTSAPFANQYQAHLANFGIHISMYPTLCLCIRHRDLCRSVISFSARAACIDRSSVGQYPFQNYNKHTDGPGTVSRFLVQPKMQYLITSWQVRP